ncbi:MAG: pseudouridine synthase [Candidatus Aureabacteria bacterium]|nr:pseudouridine synthase [Candidatus Auribacterota bacterium]
MKQRLQKILAGAGVGSRRACEQLIREGRVRVNGITVTKLGSGADPAADTIIVDGERITTEKKIYLMLHKPPGYVCSRSDESDRPTVYDLLMPVSQRLFTIGRLDRDAEGLILLTNDGDFALRAAHPRGKVGKIYQVYFKGQLSSQGRKGLERGIVLDGKRTLPAKILSAKRFRDGGVMAIEIREGKKRQVKRMFLAVGCPVQRLRRVAIGNLTLGDLRPGKYRFLAQWELDKIFTQRP